MLCTCTHIAFNVLYMAAVLMKINHESKPSDTDTMKDLQPMITQIKKTIHLQPWFVSCSMLKTMLLHF